MRILKVNIALAGALFALAFAPDPSRADDTMPICKDGSIAAHAGRGACSGHGGIDQAATKAAGSASAAPATGATETAPAAGTSAPMAGTQSSAAGTSILCKDGTFSAHAGRGACSGHGGVDHSAPATTPSSAAPAGKTAATGAQADGTSTVTPAQTTASSRSSTRLAQAPRTEAAPGGGPGKVWVNTDSKVYHCPGDRWYGKTMQGEYMTESAAKAQGYRADHNKACE